MTQWRQGTVPRIASLVRLSVKFDLLYQAAKRLTDVPHVSWPRLSRPSTSFQAAPDKDVGGRPSPVMTRISQAQRVDWYYTDARAWSLPDLPF
jgi:hypothetical protein